MWEKFLEDTFTLKEVEGPNKVCDIKDAVRRHVKPGMNLYMGERANAFLSEVIRQFHGTQPGFTLTMLFVMEQALNLVHCGLARRIITTSCTEFFPTPGPGSPIQKAFKEKRVEIENWSLCTLSQRLLAGAMDLPFMPTRSIAGSSMARENVDSFAQIPDPFDHGPFDHAHSVNLIQALKPDIALIHAWAADPAGNTIMAPCAVSGEYSHGAKASKNGVIVTVEHIVSTQFIREHAALVTLPAGIVNSVSLAPFGAHPQGMVSNYGIEAFKPYVDDYEFTRTRRGQARNPQKLDDWIKTWVMDCPSHEAYLEKLGKEKTTFLVDKGMRRDWKDQLAGHSLSYSPEYNSREMMIIAAARKTKEMVLKNRYDGVLCGVGTSGLPGWVAYYELKKEGYDLNLWIGSGIYGFAPRPGDPQLCSLPTIMSARMLTSGMNAYGIFVGGMHRDKYMSILSAAELDQNGNLNSTKISDTMYMTGSGGGNDAVNAHEVMVVLPQSAKRFVPQVSYTTCPGANTTVIISDMGILERIDGEFVLTAFFPDPNASTEEIIRKIRENCGWELKVSPQPVEVLRPSLEELVTLRALDPEGYFI